jgi:hypothetical protein
LCYCIEAYSAFERPNETQTKCEGVAVSCASGLRQGLSEQTCKLEGWKPQGRPAEDTEIQAHRQLLVEIVFSLWYRKKEQLARMDMPPQPVSLLEIWREFQSRREGLRSIRQWPYFLHGKRYVDRRVNEVATAKYAENGLPKVVAVHAGAYQPNPKLFCSDGVRK